MMLLSSGHHHHLQSSLLPCVNGLSASMHFACEIVPSRLVHYMQDVFCVSSGDWFSMVTWKQHTCLEHSGRVYKTEAKMCGLQVVQGLPHVPICCEDDRLQPLMHIRHLNSSPSSH